MKVWYVLVDMLALFVLIITINTTYHRMNIYEQEYNAQRLSKATEYATAAAFQETLGKISDNIDYENVISVSMDTTKTMEAFDDMMCFNYGLARTSQSKQAIEDSIRTAVHAAEDGYYILTTGDDGENGLKLMWSPKLPYSYEAKDSRGNLLGTYAVSLQTEDWIKVDNNGKVTKGKKYSEVSGEVNNKKRKQAVSKTLTDAITYSVDHNDYARGDAVFGTYIPSEQTITGINDIKTPSIMFIIQGADYTGEVSSDNVALTGLRTIKKVKTLGYEDRTGTKKYCYEWQKIYHTADEWKSIIGVTDEQWNDITKSNKAAKSLWMSMTDVNDALSVVGKQDRYINIKYFTSQEKAAEAGYKPDHDFIYGRVDI